MTISSITLANLSANEFNDTVNGSTAVAVKASSGTLYHVECDNTANAAATYVKLWDLASGSVTVGTTAPDWVFKIPASVRITQPIPGGVAFGTALTVASLTTGGTAGTTAPSSATIVRIVYS